MRGVRELPSSFEELEDFQTEKFGRILTAEEIRVAVREASAFGLRKTIHELYFDEGLTQREVAESLGISRGKVQSVFKVMGWTARRQTRAIDAIEVHELYEKERLTQDEIAKRFNVSKSYIYKTLKEVKPEDLRKQRRVDVDLERLHFFYCEMGLTQMDIAKALGVGQTTLSRRIRELGWEREGRKSHVDIQELHRLYFEEEYSLKETAVVLGVPLKRVKDRFRKMGWKAGPRGTIIDIEEVHRMLNKEKKDRNEIAVILGVSQSRLEKTFAEIEQDNFHQLHKKHGSNSYRLEAKELREAIFGRECKICNASQDERMLAVHRKDGALHKPEVVWNPESLRSLHPEDWVMLCPRCHRAVHWSKTYLSMKWQDFSRVSNNEELDSYQTKKTIEQNSREVDSVESIRTLRFSVFGDECAICNRDAENHKLVLHRKDGKSHHRNSTWTEEFLQNAIVDDWVMLCDRCHTGVHWFMEYYDVKWYWIKKHLSET